MDPHGVYGDIPQDGHLCDHGVNIAAPKVESQLDSPPLSISFLNVRACSEGQMNCVTQPQDQHRYEPSTVLQVLHQSQQASSTSWVEMPTENRPDTEQTPATRLGSPTTEKVRSVRRCTRSQPGALRHLQGTCRAGWDDRDGGVQAAAQPHRGHTSHFALPMPLTPHPCLAHAPHSTPQPGSQLMHRLN